MLTQLSNFWHEWNWLIVTSWGFGLLFTLMLFKGVSINNNKED